MTVGRVLVGAVLLVVALVPLVGGAWALGGRLLGWRGVPARLVEVVLALSTFVVVSELLGLVGLYRVVPMELALVAAGAAEWWWARRSWPGSPPADGVPAPSDPHVQGSDDVAPTQLGRWGAVVTAVVVGVLVADWAPRVIDAYHYGMLTIDTLWYHMPMATRWVQTGSLAHVQYFDSDAVTAFYPANGELVHGWGILATGGDLLSPLLDLIWLVLALVAGWCIGRRYRLAPLTLAGVAVVFATPSLVGTQPGGAYTDVVSIAMLLSCFAILVEAHRREQASLAAYAVAALAAGWALGAKFTMLPPVGALTIGAVVAAPRAVRWRRTGVWVAGLTVTGSFWYLRNLVAVGSPLPSLGIKFGPLQLHNLSDSQAVINSVSHYLFQGATWRRYLVPGLDGSLSWAWWILLGLAVAGMVGVLAWGPTRAHRLLAFVALASLIGYVFTPQIIGPPNAPIYFGVNVRYLATALVLGFVALPAVAVRWPALRLPILAAYVLLLASLQLNPTLWPIHVLSMSFVPAIRGTDSALGLAVGVVVAVVGVALALGRDHLEGLRRRRWAVAAGVVVAVVVVGLVVTPAYQRNRYATDRNPFLSYIWARDLHGQRIGVYGASGIIQYPMTGSDLSNHVQVLGLQGADGSYRSIQDCRTWRRVVDAGHYQYVYVTGGLGASQQDRIRGQAWIRGAPTATPVAGTNGLYRLHGPLDPSACPASRPG